MLAVLLPRLYSIFVAFIILLFVFQQTEQMILKDSRIKLMNEILSGIKVSARSFEDKLQFSILFGKTSLQYTWSDKSHACKVIYITGGKGSKLRLFY